MANLGSQAGSGLDASDITTGTLGNTVQDNVTRLGTVTVGNLSNTAIVHRTGTIIQTVAENYIGGNSDTTTSDTQVICEASSVKHWKCTIDNVLADSEVLINVTFTFELAHLGIDPNCGFSIWRGTSTKIFPSGNEGQAAFYFCPRTTGTQTQFYCGTTNIQWLDNSPDTGSTTYYLGYACGHTTVKIGSTTSSSTAHDFTMILQEIAG